MINGALHTHTHQTKWINRKTRGKSGRWSKKTSGNKHSAVCYSRACVCWRFSEFCSRCLLGMAHFGYVVLLLRSIHSKYARPHCFQPNPSHSCPRSVYVLAALIPIVSKTPQIEDTRSFRLIFFFAQMFINIIVRRVTYGFFVRRII